MPTPLEYLFMMMLSTPGTMNSDASALANIEPASGDALARESLMLTEDGRITTRTILMESRNGMEEALEAPVRITPEWIPTFKIGTTMPITLDETGKTYDAKIIRIENITDASGQTVQAILQISDANKTVQPGMTGTATLSSVQ